VLLVEAVTQALGDTLGEDDSDKVFEKVAVPQDDATGELVSLNVPVILLVPETEKELPTVLLCDTVPQLVEELQYVLVTDALEVVE
jgi:hypothetical protein